MTVHIHHWVINDNGVGVCQLRDCLLKVKQFQHQWLAMDIKPDRWNEYGFDRVPLRLQRIEESYE